MKQNEIIYWIIIFLAENINAARDIQQDCDGLNFPQQQLCTACCSDTAARVMALKVLIG